MSSYMSSYRLMISKHPSPSNLNWHPPNAALNLIQFSVAVKIKMVDVDVIDDDIDIVNLGLEPSDTVTSENSTTTGEEEGFGHRVAANWTTRQTTTTKGLDTAEGLRMMNPERIIIFTLAFTDEMDRQKMNTKIIVMMALATLITMDILSTMFIILFASAYDGPVRPP